MSKVNISKIIEGVGICSENHPGRKVQSRSYG